jgi:hypothetical protein
MHLSFKKHMLMLHCASYCLSMIEIDIGRLQKMVTMYIVHLDLTTQWSDVLT